MRARIPAVTRPAGRVQINWCGIPSSTVRRTVTPATGSQYRAWRGWASSAVVNAVPATMNGMKADRCRKSHRPIAAAAIMPKDSSGPNIMTG